MANRMRSLVATFVLLFTVLENVHCDAPLVDSAALPLEHRAVYGPPAPSPVYGTPGLLSGGGGSGGHLGGGGGGGDDPWPLSASNDSPQIKHLQVQCEKTHMRVNIEFDRPFYGMIFSKGFYSDPHCVHLKPGTGHLSATFEIFLNSCGMSSSANHNAASFGGPTPSGSYVENTIIIQYDPYVQEVWDQARKLRCTWYDFYEKAVTFRPFQVDMLHAVTANFLGDNLQCWMQIQVGKGPWASEVSGIVKIGQTMTMVLAIKDDENKFDMLVRNCVAHDGKRAPIQLVDQHGCVVRPKIMSKFQKIKNFGPSASVVSFAYFQAFKFPDSMNVHFQCVIQVCRYNCPEPKCAGGDYGLPALTGNGISGEYGAPGALSGEYGPPPHLSEYGVPPAAYPDPRHPSDASGAYSENQDSVVPPPQAQTSGSSAENKSDGPANGNEGNGQSQAQSSNPSANDIHDHISMPPPPPPGQTSYVTVTKQQQQQQQQQLQQLQQLQQQQQQQQKKQDDGLPSDNSGNLVSLGGRPRSVEGLDDLRGVRRRRDTMAVVIRPRIYKRDAQEMTDVNTERIIQVVAPGDVNFALNNASGNETVVIQSQRTVDPETICMSVPSFVGGLVMLLLVLAVASLVAAFLFVRVRHFDRKANPFSGH